LTFGYLKASGSGLKVATRLSERSARCGFGVAVVLAGAIQDALGLGCSWCQDVSGP